MNRKSVLNFTGKTVMLEAYMMLFPTVISYIYKESSGISFVITAAIALAVGLPMVLFTKEEEYSIYEREGFVIVSLSWIILSLIGALPFVISGQIPNYIDALFETVSGFTTTGASILTDVEALSKGMLFWRALTQWIGGMGILVFVVMMSSKGSAQSMQIMKAEMPGPIIGKVVPRAKDTAKALYLIYIGITLIQIILLAAGGMSVYDSIVHSLATASTGGFGIKADSLAGYNPFCQWVITIFMLVYGVNFNLYYLVLRKRIKDALKSEELKVYIVIVLASVGIIAFNIRNMYSSLEELIRTSAFQVASIMTTSGFATADFNLWPVVSKIVLILLMFCGACAGSTAGGLKISRVIILFKSIGCELRRLIQPRRVGRFTIEGKTVDSVTLHNTLVYFVIYMILVTVFTCLVLILEPVDMATGFSAVAATFNNIGPGLGPVGPAGSFAAFGGLTKLILTLSMLLGRLEIYPLLLTFSVYSWKNQ